MPTLLVIDDEESILHAFRQNFREPAYTLLTAASAEEGVERVRDRPDVVILDVHLPDSSGLETFEQIRRADARIPVILITGHGTTELAIEAIKRGAFDYLLKPPELPQLREIIARACASSRLMSVPAVVPDEALPHGPADVLVGRCPSMQEVYKAVGRVAPQDVNVLILGESGTGKELVARAIYQHSRRADRPFLAINCAAIPEPLLESELFGHEKGAFTGADRKRIGKFEQCTGGTLFLDEVGDMTPLTQTKILRVLQDQTFERVGGNETVQTDVRLIAATNSDLDKLVADGRFRNDLYFRLNVFTIRLPSLRERGDDLSLLVDYFIKRFARELGKTVHAVPAETLEVLRRYHWPGNVRELQSVLKQALLQMSGSVLLPEFLPSSVLAPPLPAAGTVAEPPSAPASSAPSTEGGFDWDRFVADRIAAGTKNLYDEGQTLMEREVITRVLRHCSGNQVQAARILGITRSTLRGKINLHKITIERAVWAGDEQGE
ncbi:MAG: sigma-54-dependent Fis family transcriptional regulator [Planctomycetes bacterium]|nr:sigma-54-dependent Fis family transcriptional regulator [Planctomycetota bacterium]